MSPDPVVIQARALLDEHLPMLRAYARNLVASPGDADDVAQDVCVEVLANPGILLRGTDAGAYLRGIARHLTHRHARRFRRHRPLEELIDLVWDESADGHELDPQTEVEALHACLAELNQRLRGMVALRYQEGLNASDIGNRLSLSAEAVRMALLRGRQALGRCLEKRLQREVPS